MRKRRQLRRRSLSVFVCQRAKVSVIQVSGWLAHARHLSGFACRLVLANHGHVKWSGGSHLTQEDKVPENSKNSKLSGIDLGLVGMAEIIAYVYFRIWGKQHTKEIFRKLWAGLSCSCTLVLSISAVSVTPLEGPCVVCWFRWCTCWWQLSCASSQRSMDPYLGQSSTLSI